MAKKDGGGDGGKGKKGAGKGAHKRGAGRHVQRGGAIARAMKKAAGKVEPVDKNALKKIQQRTKAAERGNGQPIGNDDGDHFRDA